MNIKKTVIVLIGKSVFIINLLLIPMVAVFALTACAGPMTPTSSASFSQTSANVASVKGLNLSLSINTTFLYPGESTSFTIDEKNTLAKESDVPIGNLWSIKRLIIAGNCGTLNYPFGIAIFQGDYTVDNVTSAVPLQLYDPNGVTSCPMMLAGITAYNFRPHSDNAVVITSYNEARLTIPMAAGNIPVRGFWSGSQNATFSAFTPGVYTIAAGDEWGALVVLHFVVNWHQVGSHE